MKIKTSLAVIALTLVPTIVLADGGCNRAMKMQSAAQCAVGQIWDVPSQSCVAAVNS